MVTYVPPKVDPVITQLTYLPPKSDPAITHAHIFTRQKRISRKRVVFSTTYMYCISLNIWLHIVSWCDCVTVFIFNTSSLKEVIISYAS